MHGQPRIRFTDKAIVGQKRTSLYYKVLSEGNLLKWMLQLQHSSQKSLTALQKGPEFSNCQHELPQIS